jgi:hypothetical protein
MEIGFAADVCDLLRRPDVQLPAAAAAAGALRSFTTADDERPPASKAFAHARMLAKNQQALLVGGQPRGRGQQGARRTAAAVGCLAGAGW